MAKHNINYPYEILSDAQLIECYKLSMELQLEKAFIDLLQAEMDRRNLQIGSLHGEKG